MNKMLVAVFDTENAAYEGLSALQDLHSEGSIALYATGVIAKDESGSVLLKQVDDQGPVGTVLGMAMGSLVGLLGGPAGVAVGAAVGAWGGMVADLNEAGVDVDFVDEVSAALTPGKSAVVAEVDEAWVAPVDTRLGEHGGLVFRRLRSEVVDEQLVREAEAFNWELTELEEEAAQASAEAKEKISQRIAATKQRLQAIQDQANAKIEQAKNQQETKVQTLQNQLQEAAAEKKAKIENRISEVKTDYAARSSKLKEAWNMTKQALA